MTASISHKGVEIEYEVERSDRANPMISVRGDKVTVNVPHSMNDLVIRSVVRKDAAWILKTLEKNKMVTDARGKKNVLVYEGKEAPYHLITGQEKDDITYKRGKFIIRTRSPSLSHHDLMLWYHEWLLESHTKYVERRTQSYSKMIGVEPTAVYISDITKWGSVSQSGEITINLNLLKMPFEILDYIILCEVVRLKIPGSSKEFWDYLGSFMQDYKKRKAWLKENGERIMLTGSHTH